MGLEEPGAAKNKKERSSLPMGCKKKGENLTLILTIACLLPIAIDLTLAYRLVSNHGGL